MYFGTRCQMRCLFYMRSRLWAMHRCRYAPSLFSVFPHSPLFWLGLCNACQECVADATSAAGYSCLDKPNVCKPCEQCDVVTGQCSSVQCDSCQTCNPAINRCEIAVNATCISETHPCRVAYCDASGTCITTANISAVGARCRLQQDCIAYVCTADGQVLLFHSAASWCMSL